MSLEFISTPDASGNVVCRCPFHADKHPSASYNINTGLFYCFSCKVGANKWQLENVYGVVVPDTSNLSALIKTHNDDKWEDMWRYSTQLYCGDEYETIADYVAGRGLTDKEIIEYDIHFTPTSVMFPFKTLSGGIIGFQERRLNAEPKYMLRGDMTKFWPYEKILEVDENDIVFLTEGVFGAIRLRQLGMVAFSVIGTKLNVVDEIVNMFSQIVPTRNIVAVFDNDYPGHKATWAYLQKGCAAFIPGIEADEIDERQARLIQSSSITILEANRHEIDLFVELFQ